MRILMIAPQPFFTSRGTPLSVYYRLLTLSELGNSVDLFTYHIGEDVALPNVSIHRIINIPFIRTVRIGPSVLKIFLDALLFVKASWHLMMHAKDYDLMYVHEEALVCGTCLKKLFKKKLIYDMHSSLPQQFDNFKYCNFRFVKGVFSFIERKGIEASDYVITICDDLQDYVQKMGFIKAILIENTRIEPLSFKNALDAGTIQHEHEIRRVIEEKEKNKILLYCGTFEKYQGIPLLLEAFTLVKKECGDITLLLIGGSPSQIAEMKELAAKLSIQNSVCFAGNMKPNFIKSVIQRVDMLISCRISGTNTPLKMYEYMSSGVPIVATEIYSHTQLLDADTSFLAQPNVHDFSSAMRECLSDAPCAQRKALNAKRYFQDNFSTEQYKARITAVLEQVMDSPH